MIENLGGRKAVALLVMTLVGVGAVFLKGDVPANFLSLMEFIFAGFVAGNAVEHAAGAYSDARATPDAPEAPAPLVDFSSLVGELDTLKTAVAASQEGISTIQQTLTFIIQKTGIGTK